MFLLVLISDNLLNNDFKKQTSLCVVDFQVFLISSIYFLALPQNVIPLSKPVIFSNQFYTVNT